MRNGRLGAAVAALVGTACATASCSGDEPAAQEATPATPSITQPTASPIAKTLGREATIRAWLKELVDMQNTGATEAFLSLSSTTCNYCKEFSKTVEDVYRAGGEATAHPMAISGVQRQHGTDNTYIVFFSAKGGTVRPHPSAKPHTFPGGPEMYEVGLKKEDSSWRVNSFERIMVSQ